MNAVKAAWTPPTIAASNYYYYRPSKAYPLVGPMSLKDAEDIARW